jgi:hypothetical protein
MVKVRKTKGSWRTGQTSKAKSGITKRDFHAILDKASQPIKHEAESDSKQP